MYDSDVEINAILVHETEDAYLIQTDNCDRVWLPKSQCQYDGNKIFTVKEWLAIKKELV